MGEQTNPGPDLEGLREALRQLDWRLTRVESALRLTSAGEGRGGALGPRQADGVPPAGADPGGAALELRIGELWLGQVGIVTLLLGIAFFISYPFGLPPAFQVLAGYLAAMALYLLSRRWESSYAFGARTFFAGCLLLAYFSTLRLHFFTPSPLVASKPAGLILLAAVLAVLFRVAIVRRLEHLAVIALSLGFVTSLCTDTGHFALCLATVTAGASVYLQWRVGWWREVVLCVFLAYATHLLWMFNNPVLGRPVQAVADPHHNLVYLFLCAALFGIANLPQGQKADASPAGVGLAFLNAAGFAMAGAIVGATYFRSQFAEIGFLFAAFFLALASVYWQKRQSTYVTALYACFGYVALSAAIIARLEGPDRFIWLGWQGLLVISTAVWFRSKIVVVANIFIYLGILLVYLLLQPPTLSVNLSYAAVSLLSARVLNWQREHLALKTELMRNIYLGSAFVVVPYGLYHGVPENYVSLSWLGVALFYFAVSLALRNLKYRWMAIWTIFLTVIHVFVLDVARLNPAFRMVSFLILGLCLLVVSWLYARHRKARESVPQPDGGGDLPTHA